MPYLTVEELKAHLGITETGDDPLLQEAIDDAAATVNAQTNRVFEAQTATRFYRRESLLESNRAVLWINDDLLTVTALLNADSANTAITTGQYWLLDRNAGPPYHAIELLANSGVVWIFDVDEWVSVTGTWGYSTAVPADVKRATTRLAAFYYRQKDSQIFDTTAIPEAGVITIPAGLERTFERLVEKYKRYIR